MTNCNFQCVSVSIVEVAHSQPLLTVRQLYRLSNKTATFWLGLTIITLHDISNLTPVKQTDSIILKHLWQGLVLVCLIIELANFSSDDIICDWINVINTHVKCYWNSLCKCSHSRKNVFILCFKNEIENNQYLKENNLNSFSLISSFYSCFVPIIVWVEKYTDIRL